MLTKSKRRRLLAEVKAYHRRYLRKKLVDLDESGTRLMVNTFLTEVLGFASIEEVKTEYMIKGTYADYVIQIRGTRHFLVEVKSLSLTLTDKHLRQAINYGANEGIEWVLLTNGRQFELYRIIFGKPIDSKRVLSIDLSDRKSFKGSVEQLQHMHKESIVRKGLDELWNKCMALDPSNVAGILMAPQVVNFIRRTLRRKFRAAFSDEEVAASIRRVIMEVVSLEGTKVTRGPRRRRGKLKDQSANAPGAASSDPAGTKSE
jgi:hypothetical protein